MTRILVFSPYALWTIHTIYEKTITQACEVRGAEIEYLLCDGLLPECDLHWDSKTNSPRPFDICQRCQATAKADMEDVDLPHRWLGEFVSRSEQSEAFAWAQGLKPDDFRDASFKGAPIGSWVLSSVISYFRKYPPDLNDWHAVNVFRGFLYSAAIVVIGLERYLDERNVDAALLFNGRQSIVRVAMELFQRRGIRVLTHERAEYNRGHINAKPNAHCMSPFPFKKVWKQWADVPLTRPSLVAAYEWLTQRQSGVNLAWIPFNKFAEPDTSLRQRLGISGNKRLWTLFTSSTDETAGDPDMKGPFDSQTSWVRDVIHWTSSRDDIELVIKVHPNLGGNLYIGKAASELRLYEEMKETLPPNIHIVLPEDEVSAYSLAKESDVGLTFGSIMGLEMAMLGKLVLVASRALYDEAPQFVSVRSVGELPVMLERCMQPFSSREIRRSAFRLAYYYVCQFELAFPPITVLNIYEAKANYSTKEELIDGYDTSLDRICNFLIEGTPLFDSPTKEELSRSTAEEDAFFDELENGGVLAMDVNQWLEPDAAVSIAEAAVADKSESQSGFGNVGRAAEKWIRQALSRALRVDGGERTHSKSEETQK